MKIETSRIAPSLEYEHDEALQRVLLRVGDQVAALDYDEARFLAATIIRDCCTRSTLVETWLDMHRIVHEAESRVRAAMHAVALVRQAYDDAVARIDGQESDR